MPCAKARKGQKGQRKIRTNFRPVAKYWFVHKFYVAKLATNESIKAKSF